ncbi:MAG: HAMP domain-containing histidine kinase [Eubacterium sp.]|nr:HAMP domain-containing histidine kinase [Eubacterium sp.]
MKLLRTTTIIFVLLMIVGIFFFVRRIEKTEYGKSNIVYYNDQLHRVQADLISGLTEKEVEKKYNCRIVMSTDPNEPELLKLFSQRALIMDITYDGEIIGKVAWTDIKDHMEAQKRGLIISVIIIWIIIMVGVSGIIFTVYYFMVKPVKEMKSYSQEIAKGNLDASIPIHKNNLFGSFTESFDIMREELKASREREIQAEKAKKEMVAELSHDIKTPVATIQTTCEVLKLKAERKLKMYDETDIQSDSGKNGELVEAKDIIEKVDLISAKADVINQLMQSIFHATLEELDHIHVEKKEESSLIIKEYFERMNMNTSIILENDMPEYLVYMDKLRMEQVFDNIIGNSIKYAGTDINVYFSEAEGAKRSDGSSDRFLKITVRDHGPGVPEEELPLISEKYYRGKNVQGKSGYGIGLYLVKNYMEKQGGGMEYYNDDGFVVELYLKKVG